MSPFLSLRGWRIAAIGGCIASLVACGGGGSSHDEVGPVDVAPTVTLQPVDATVAAPGTATFTAAASGSPAPTVQWQRSADAGATWTAIAGATSASYTTPASVAGDDGARFRAVFSNEAGSATSDAGRLTVASTPLVPGLSLLAGDIGGYGTLDGTGSEARFVSPTTMAADGSGNLYVGDCQAHNVRRITLAGVVTTLAGPDTLQDSGNVDATGTVARFACPAGLAVDAAGNVFVGDSTNRTVRRITPAGAVTTVAGGNSDFTHTDGVGSAARFGQPMGVAVDSHGNVFVADASLHSIRKVAPDRTVTTFAGVSSNAIGSLLDGIGASARFIGPQSMAIDADDNLYVGDGSRLRKVTPSAVVTTIAGAAALSDARGLAVDATGNVYVTDRSVHVVRKVTAAGVMTTFAGTQRQLVSDGYADGTGAAAAFKYPSGIAVGSDGNVYVSEEGNLVVRKITPAAVVTTFAGRAALLGDPALFGDLDGIGDAARFSQPNGLGADASGNLYETGLARSTVRKITPAGVVSTYAGSTAEAGSADGSLTSARFVYPWSTAGDVSGNLFVADTGNRTVRKISASGTVTTLAGTAGTSGSVDGSGAAARFDSLASIAVDSVGNVYVVDSAANVVRKITPAGVTTTLAGMAYTSGSADGNGAQARFNGPYGVAVDAAGNVLVADSGNNTIRKVTPAGDVTTVAGSAGTAGGDDGSGAAARFDLPFSLATDAAGNAYVADAGGGTIRKVTATGVVSTVLGSYRRIGVRLGTGSDASLSFPSGIVVLPNGQLAFISAGAVLRFTLP